MMQQAIGRFTRLIGVLAKAPDGLALHEIARRSDLPPATCTRGLKVMVALGWADQAGNRGDYHLGPQATALSIALPYQGRLLHVAVPRLQRLAQRHPGTGVSVVTLRHGRRFGLWSQQPDPAWRGGLKLLAHDDLWSMPSGRLLVALLTPRARRSWIARAGLPTPLQWPGIADQRELEAELAELRRARRAEVVREGTAYLAMPVGPAAIIGCWRAGARIPEGVARSLGACTVAVTATLESAEL